MLRPLPGFQRPEMDHIEMGSSVRGLHYEHWKITIISDDGTVTVEVSGETRSEVVSNYEQLAARWSSERDDPQGPAGECVPEVRQDAAVETSQDEPDGDGEEGGWQ